LMIGWLKIYGPWLKFFYEITEKHLVNDEKRSLDEVQTCLATCFRIFWSTILAIEFLKQNSITQFGN
jgi:hypothetical protein